MAQLRRRLLLSEDKLDRLVMRHACGLQLSDGLLGVHCRVRGVSWWG